MNKRLWAFCTIFLQLFCISFSQPVLNPPTYWKHLPLLALPQPPRSQLLPSAYAAFELDGRLLQQLDALSARAGSQGERELLLYVPTPEGSYEPFYIRPANIMAPGLAARYTRIRAYQGVHAKQPATEIRLERGPSGLHAMIFGQGQSVFIAPIYPNDSRLYMAYYKQQAPRRGPFSCSLKTEHLRGDLPQPTARSGDCLLRTYRLAVATTGEYTAYHGGTVEQALAAIVTTINRVNGIFEREVGVRMVLIDSTDQLIFTDPVSDPFTNDNGSEMLTQNQQLCDARIGSANYDIGHVFSTNGGGIAYLRSVCEAGYKAGGVTGQPYPQGDAFDIDFVAHEMGHQFGATHTQNNDCNRSNNSAFEPGSASTIMGYAGICPPNIQTHSDAMFHAFSIAQIRQFIEGEANGCANIQPLNNQPPTANAGVDAYIPAATPFFLRGSATDPDAGQQLTYSWEQMDNEIASMPPEADATGGPLFRTFLPSTEPVRYFPAYEDLRTNKSSPWEVLPTVSRELNFRLTVRDNAPGGGCTAADDVVLQVVGQAGPFAISWPQAGTNWTGGTYQEVRWQVAGTDQPPISCGAVDVLLSVDGGRTFPYVLADSAPNTGAVVVQLPEVSSQQARILLQGHGHRFFHLLPQNFSITEAAAPGFSMLVQQGESLACPADTFVYQVQLSSLKGFEQPVTLSVSGLPEGTVAQWGTNPLMPSGSTELRLVLPAHALPGQYQLSLLAQAAGAQSQQAQLSLRMLSAQPLAGDELMPRHGSREVDPGRELSWLPASGPATYELQWSLNPAFLPGEIQHITQLDENRYLPAEPFPANEVIYWRVRAVNACGSGPFGPARAFHTAAINCWRVVSTDSVPIPQSGTPTVVSTIAVQQAETLSRLRIRLHGTHSWVNDLSATLISPAFSTAVLFEQVCDDEQDFDVGFDDEASLAQLPCPPVSEAYFRPKQPLARFAGENSQGNWNLNIRDNANLDGGALLGWEMEMCAEGGRRPVPLLSQLDTLLVAVGASAVLSKEQLLLTDSSSQAAQLVYTLEGLPAYGSLYVEGQPLTVGAHFSQADVESGRISYAHAGSQQRYDAFSFSARNEAGGWTGTLSLPVKVTGLVGTLPPAAGPLLRVYPNPARKYLLVEVGDNGPAAGRARLFSLQGQQVLAAGVSGGRARLEVGALAPGLYMLQVEAGGMRWHEQVWVR